MVKILKKIVFYLVPVLAIVYGYQFITGRSIATLPTDVVDILYNPEVKAKSTNPRYYRDPAEKVPQE